MLFSDYKCDPITINDKKYRVKKWNPLTTTAEGFKLVKVATPFLTVIADLKMGKPSIEKELDEIYQEQFSNEFMMTQAFAQVRELLEEDHFLDLQEKLLKGLQVKDEAKDEWLDVNWVDHISNPENEGDYLELLLYSGKANLFDFFMKQGMFSSLIETASPMIKKMKESLKEQAEKVSSDQDS